MRVRTGRELVAGLGVLGVLVVGAASFAWACSIQTEVRVTPGSGPASGPAWVYGSGFGNGPVEIRWNGANGPQIGAATGPNFNVRVTIPNVAPRVYTIMAVQKDVLGTTSRTSFQVTSQSTAPSTGGGTPDNGTANNGTASNGTTQDSGTQDGGVPTSNGGGSSSSEPRATAAPAGNATTGSNGPRAESTVGANPSADSRASEPATADASASRSSVASPSAASPSSARGAMSASPAVAGATASPAAPAVPGASGVAAENGSDQPAARTAAGDLWSGFTGSSSPTRGASLLDSPEGAGQGSAMVMGMGVLTVGLVALGLGFSTAELRRRRVVVRSAATRR